MFKKLRKATITRVSCVGPSVCLFALNYSVAAGWIFMKFHSRGFLETLPRKINYI